jgi:hypothetical protein
MTVEPKNGVPTDTCATLTINVTSTPTATDPGLVTATAAGGTTPYGFRWSDRLTNAARSLSPGEPASVTVTDVAGCTKTSPVFIGVPRNPVDLGPVSRVVAFSLGVGEADLDIYDDPTTLYNHEVESGASLTGTAITVSGIGRVVSKSDRVVITSNTTRVMFAGVGSGKLMCVHVRRSGLDGITKGPWSSWVCTVAR